MHRYSDVLFVKAGAFIAGDNCGPKNYRFEKVILVHSSRVSDRLYLDSLPGRVTGENIPLVTSERWFRYITPIMDSIAVTYQLAQGETISVESGKYSLALFTQDFDYSVRFHRCGCTFQKRSAFYTLTVLRAGMYALPYCQTATRCTEQCCGWFLIPFP